MTIYDNTTNPLLSGCGCTGLASRASLPKFLLVSVKSNLLAAQVILATNALLPATFIVAWVSRSDRYFASYCTAVLERANKLGVDINMSAPGLWAISRIKVSPERVKRINPMITTQNGTDVWSPADHIYVWMLQTDHSGIDPLKQDHIARFRLTKRLLLFLKVCLLRWLAIFLTTSGSCFYRRRR